MTSNVNELSARLRRQTEAEELETTAIAARELRKFGETLSASANDKLRITEAAMEGQVGRIQGLLWRAWLRPLVVGLFVFPGIFVGSWGLTQWQSSRVERLVERQEVLRLAITQEQQALAQLQAADVGSVAPRGGGRDDGTWCCPWGRWARTGGGPCKGSLPCSFRASEGAV